MKKRITIAMQWVLVLMPLLLGITPMQGQGGLVLEPAKWQMKLDTMDQAHPKLIFTAKMKEGWHIYSTDVPQGGPEATSLNIEKIAGGKLVGSLTAGRAAREVFDPNFNMKIGMYDDEVTFSQELELTSNARDFSIIGYIRYMACTEEQCTPPESFEFELLGNAQLSPLAEIGSEAGAEEAIAPLNFATTSQEDASSNRGALWTPVVDELKSFGDDSLSSADSSYWMLFVYGFLGGLVALLTPCVWPMIPMTVSFFLKRTKSRKKGVVDAIKYGLSIIVIYLALGLLVTAVFGSSALNDLATNAVFNIIFFLLLVFFAISFFGAFELILPAKWTNKIDSKADSTSGLLSIFFMAFTLALVSFSCTGPIIGTLLVQAASMGEMMGPAVGMLGFSTALALPFTLFAVFPSLLQSLPKSGGWLNSVKVTLAFLELALSLKFLSVADLAYGWHLLDREVFVALWIVIFALLGIYHLGKLRFSHDSPASHTSVPGLFIAIVSLGFSVYMLPGLWGAPLKAISAFAPPLKTQDFSLYDGEVHAKFDDYEAGMDYARKMNKPVLIDFSGFGCVNCRKMEASVWTDPEVKSLLENDYVLITLMVDDKTNLSEPIEVEQFGKKRKLRTVGDKWSYLQSSKFGANTQPYYIALDNEGKPLNKSYSYDEDVEKYINFLEKGLTNYKAKQ